MIAGNRNVEQIRQATIDISLNISDPVPESIHEKIIEIPKAIGEQWHELFDLKIR